MKVWNVPADAITRIVDLVSRTRYHNGWCHNLIFQKRPEADGKAVSFTLTVATASGPGGRHSPAGRRIAAACWHCHRDVMAVIYALYPDARIKTSVAYYRSRVEFHQLFEGTGNMGIGPRLRYRDACDCEKEGNTK